jgi:hypothetical protein
MDREQAADALAMLRKVVAKTRDDTALQNWGLIWVCSAFSNGGGFYATHVLLSRGTYAPWPFVGVWAVVFLCNGIFIAALREKRVGAPSFIDRLTFSLWNVFIAAMSLVAVINYLMGIRVLLFMPAVACVLAAMTWAVMGAVMGRAWFVPAGIWAAMSLVMALLPGQQFALFAGLWALTQGVGGAMLHREKLALRAREAAP